MICKSIEIYYFYLDLLFCIIFYCLFVFQVIHNLLLSDNIENGEKDEKDVKSEDKGLVKSSLKNSFIDVIPPLLISSLIELIECSDDMLATFSSLFLEEHSLKNEGKNNEKSSTLGHIFNIPELVNIDENSRKYSDFSQVGRSVLSIISNMNKND